MDPEKEKCFWLFKDEPMRKIHKTSDLGSKAIMEDVLHINYDTLFKYLTIKRCSGLIYKNLLLCARAFKINLEKLNCMAGERKLMDGKSKQFFRWDNVEVWERRSKHFEDVCDVSMTGLWIKTTVECERPARNVFHFLLNKSLKWAFSNFGWNF